VLCSGDKNNNVKAALYRIDPLSLNIELTLSFQGINESANRLSINGTNDTLFFLNEGVCQFPINSTTLPAPLIAAGSRNFYGLGIDPRNSNIYVSDAIDYVQQGKVYIYQPNGKFLTSFATGIIPGEFCFP
jgi:DNA-binding beta-propeller fold protein YncE